MFSKLYLSCITMFLLLMIGCSCPDEHLKIDIIPHPQKIVLSSGQLSLKIEKISVAADNELSDIKQLFYDDIYRLTGKRIDNNHSNPNIILKINRQLAEEEYIVDAKKTIQIEGGSYQAVVMGVTSLLQSLSIKEDILKFPESTIRDQPYLSYRGLLLDVARKFHSIKSVQQVIDLCRWYKIKYLQLHLSDDQLCVFPSKAFPKIASEGQHYTQNELKDLVEYARKRGVSIIPEFDAPGHTTSLRRAYPEIFGTPELGMMDISNEKALQASETLIGEMMDIFYTSPYFHIGADEVWLGNFEKLPGIKKALKEYNLDSAHDLYLNYIVRMHQYVKSRGKQTLMWESFQGKGSKKVTIPNDIIVFAWETLYQMPDSLVENGYTIINASWKPCYITPTIRWTQEQVYSWNIWRWEHFLNFAEVYHNPVQFEGAMKEKVYGAQLCAWEMNEEMEIVSICNRLPALSECAWNPEKEKDYPGFQQRYAKTNDRLQKLLFPAALHVTGCYTSNDEGRFYNKNNYFTDKIGISVQPDFANVQPYYTIDGRQPDTKSPAFTELSVDSTLLLKISLRDREGNEVGYKSVLFECRPLDFTFKGQSISKDPIDWQIDFTDSLEVEIKNRLPQGDIKFALDRKSLGKDSRTFSEKLCFKSTTQLYVRLFINNKPKGSIYRYMLKKTNDES